MLSRFTRAVFASLGILLAAAPPCLAAESIASGEVQLSLSLGRGLAETPYAKGDDIDLHALPGLAYYGERWFFDNGTLGFALYETPSIQIDAQIKPNIDGLYSNFAGSNRFLFLSSAIPTPFPVDDPIMPVEKRDIAWNGGLRFTYSGETFSAWLDYGHDINGVYNSYEGALGFRLPELARVGDWRLGTEFGSAYKSRALIDYYYKPLRSEYRPPSRDLDYQPKHAFNPFLQLDSDYPLGEHFSLVAFWRRTWLDSTYRDSPFSQKQAIDTWFLGLRMTL